MTAISPLGSVAPLQRFRFATLVNLVFVDAVPSTNGWARNLVERMVAEETEVLPTAIAARTQVAGRGRGGRVWASVGRHPVAVSVIVPWQGGEERVKLPVSFGISMACGLAEIFGIDVRLKWPNDLLVGRKKLGGLLVEARTGGAGNSYAVVGLGLNVDATRAELDGAGLPEATSLLDSGVPRDRLEGDAPLVGVLSAADRAALWTYPDLPAAFARVSAHSAGDPMEVHEGRTTASGRYAGVTREGFLRLDRGAGVEVVLSGDVTTF